jgi:predicted nucleotide-binding protein
MYSPKELNHPLTRLTVPTQQASRLINLQIKRGKDITRVTPPKEISKRFLDSLWDPLRKWDDYNSTLLKRLFTDDYIASKYDDSVSFSGTKTLDEYARRILSFQRIKIRELESVKERLPLFSAEKTAATKAEEGIPIGKRVFIVHGHDEGAKQTVARFLEKLDLQVLILHEQADKGKTIIEKLEANSSDVDIGYAIVLLTPDDIGVAVSKGEKTKPRPPLRQRARQNVILELGYFIAKLGRERVRALYIDGVELPSDYQGVLYTEFDSTGAWKFELAREIKAAGIELDLNKLTK